MQLDDILVEMMSVAFDNTNTFLQSQLIIRCRRSDYQRTGITIVRHIFQVNCDCYSANASVIDVSTKCIQRRTSMDVVNATNSIIYDVLVASRGTYINSVFYLLLYNFSMSITPPICPDPSLHHRLTWL